MAKGPMLLALLFLVCACASAPVETAADRGYQALLEENWRSAEAELKAAIREDGTDVWSMLNLGVVYAATGRPDLARQQYVGVIEYAGDAVADKATDEAREGVALVKLAQENLERLRP